MKVVAYRRVSTGAQGQSGLGMDAQLTAIEQFCAAQGHTIAAWYQDIESGGVDNRHGVMSAIAHAQRMKAPIIVATLCRLSRDVHFVSGLMKHGVQFIACDGANDPPMVTQIKAVMAEDYRRQISIKTKAAMAAKKAQGWKAGNPKWLNGQWNGKPGTAESAAKARAALAAKRAQSS